MGLISAAAAAAASAELVVDCRCSCRAAVADQPFVDRWVGCVAQDVVAYGGGGDDASHGGSSSSKGVGGCRFFGRWRTE